MKKFSHVMLSTISALTALAMSLGACIVTEDHSDSIEDAVRDDVIHTNAVIEGGLLHTFESGDMIASVEVTARENALHLTYSIETSREYYETSMRYVIEGDQLVLEVSDKVAAGSAELQRLLAGTPIEDYLRNGNLDLTSGLDQDEDHFRAAACWGWKAAMIVACGATYAAAIMVGFFSAGLGAAGVIVVGSPACIAAATKWMICESQHR
jgi:hypothetical protein